MTPDQFRSSASDTRTELDGARCPTTPSIETTLWFARFFDGKHLSLGKRIT